MFGAGSLSKKSTTRCSKPELGPVASTHQPAPPSPCSESRRSRFSPTRPSGKQWRESVGTDALSLAAQAARLASGGRALAAGAQGTGLGPPERRAAPRCQESAGATLAPPLSAAQTTLTSFTRQSWIFSASRYAVTRTTPALHPTARLGADTRRAEAPGEKNPPLCRETCMDRMAIGFDPRRRQGFRF